MDVLTQELIYKHADLELIGFLAYPKQAKKLPAILIAPDWSGLNAFAKEKAIELAKQGYVAFAIDMYGHGAHADRNEDKQVLMQPLVSDRHVLRERILLAYQLLQSLDPVDKSRCAAIGFCFGGLCVLDLARTGADLKAVVSLHGILRDADFDNTQKIAAELLVLHGYDDPMVTHLDVLAFGDEMTQRGAVWQLNLYGQTMHAFTNPLANDRSFGTMYQPATAAKAYVAMHQFLSRLLF